MNFETLTNRLIQETTGTSLVQFAPELVVCATIVALLFVRLFGVDRFVSTFWFALGGTLLAFLVAYRQFVSLEPGSLEGVDRYFFTGLLVYDHFTVFFRLFLLVFLVLVIALTVLSGIPDNEDSPDFYTLLLGSVVGMMLMASANHLLIFFLAVEITSVPSYVMVGFLKGRRKSSEASLKFVVYGAGAAGVMLYGLSLLTGLLGTADLSELAGRLHELFRGSHSAGIGDPTARTVALAMMLVLVGLAFKLSVFPFHFWCPDAFEGASAEVAGFLSVASKAAAFALLVRFCLAFAGGDPGALRGVYLAMGVGLGVVAAATCTFGNLAAYVQSNVKRLLAYSTIAHAGYMLMAVAAMMVVLNAPAGGSADSARQAARCLEGLLYYLSVYLFMNLGAFAIVALLRNEIFSEEIDDYRGLWTQTPLLCVCMGICLLSLVGLPPLGGFVGKFMIFASLYEAGNIHPSMWAVLVVGALNTVFSLFYYVRVLKAMFLEPRPAGARQAVVPFQPYGLYALIVSLPVLALGVWWTAMDALSQTAFNVATVLLQ
jgi:NADH-quinone oxidoreductase subunit N